MLKISGELHAQEWKGEPLGRCKTDERFARKNVQFWN